MAPASKNFINTFSLKYEKNIEYIINNRFIFIDDIDKNTFEYINRQIICPKYEFRYYYDIPNKLVIKYKINPQIFNNIDVLNYFIILDLYYLSQRF